METINSATSIRVPWNKGKLVGQKAPFKPKEIWAIRVRLQIARRCREQVDYRDVIVAAEYDAGNNGELVQVRDLTKPMD
jgi:hypothetical protein